MRENGVSRKKKGDHAPPWPPLLYLTRPMKNRARFSEHRQVFLPSSWKKKGDHAPPWPPLLYLTRPMKNRARFSTEVNPIVHLKAYDSPCIISETEAGGGAGIEEAPPPIDTPHMPLGTGTGSVFLSGSNHRCQALARCCLSLCLFLLSLPFVNSFHGRTR